MYPPQHTPAGIEVMCAPVTVAVVSWNTRDLLVDCLRSLKPSADAGLVDVWVVDNGSTDGSREAVREEFGWVTFECPGRNLGFGAAVNLVAARTRGDWIAPANADVAPTSGAVQCLLETGERHPEAGILAPRLLLPDGSTQHSVFPLPSVRISLLLGSQLWRLSPVLADRLCLEGAWGPDRDRAVPWAIGAFLLVRRPLFDQVGGFDERQWLYAEDLDLAWRVRQAGSSTRYVPAARVRHNASAATTQAFGGQIRARHMAASYAWLRRRRGATVATAYGVANVASSLALAAWLAPPALVRPDRRPQLADALDWGRVHFRELAGRGPSQGRAGAFAVVEDGEGPQLGPAAGELVELQNTLYNSRNPTRRWLHTSRRDWIIEALRRASAVTPPERALEVGPGSGLYLPVLAGLARQVVAADVEPAFLEHAEALRAEYPNLSLAADDITATALEPGSFDLILCSEVVEHIQDSPAAIRSMHRLLRPGGTLVLSTPQRWSPLELSARIGTLPGVVRLVRLVYREPILPLGHVNLLTARQARAQLGAAGFTIAEHHLSGLYLPILAEAGGRRALALERRLEARLRTSRLSGLLWTQYFVARA